MKSKAEIARERVEAQVVTLSDGRKYASGILGLAALYPLKEEDMADTITIPTGAKERYSIVITCNDKMMVQVHAETGEVEYGEGYTPDGAARIFWQSLGDLCPAKTLADIHKLVEEYKATFYDYRLLHNFLQGLKAILDREGGRHEVEDG